MTAQAAPTVTAKELKRALDGGRPVFLLDVRSPEEHRDWRIPGSVNVPIDRLLEGARPDVPPGSELITFCLHGPRSQKARDLLAAEGRPVRSLEGGMVAWNTVYDSARIPAGPVEVRQMRRVAKGCLGYVLASGGEAVAIDPTLDADAYLEEAAKLGARLVAVLDTHAHADHASGGRLLAKRAGAPYLAPEEVGEGVADRIVRDGDHVEFGGARLRVVATPGHTPGSLTYLLDGLAFTGDTLFVESVGRPDLGQDPRPNARTLWKTLHEKLLALPRDTVVLPGHHGEAVAPAPGEAVRATLGELESRLPALRKPEDGFVDWVAQNALPKPANFDAIKRANKGLDDVDVEDLRDLEAGPNRCAVA